MHGQLQVLAQHSEAKIKSCQPYSLGTSMMFQCVFRAELSMSIACIHLYLYLASHDRHAMLLYVLTEGKWLATESITCLHL